jgi:hypothetical protein
MAHATDLALDRLMVPRVKTLHRFFLGNIRVKPASTLKINGLMIGNIIVENGARLHVDGFVIGNIINHNHCDESILINGRHIGNLVG